MADKLIPGVKARFRCKKGYALVGKRVLDCERGGYWSSDPPECVGKSILIVFRSVKIRIIATAVEFRLRIFFSSGKKIDV